MPTVNLHIQMRLFEAEIALDKALCYFQPILQVGTSVGTATFNEIRVAASALLSQCASDEDQGGIATGIGMSLITSHSFLDKPSNSNGSSLSDPTLIFDRRQWQPCSDSRNLLAEHTML